MPVRIKFAYEAGADGQERPYLWLNLTGPTGRQVQARGLLDSGSDVSVLSTSHATLLGFQDDELERLTVQHSGGTSTAYRAPSAIVANLPGESERPVPLQPIFIENAVEPRWGRDFMRVWAVALAEPDHQFSLFAE